MAPIALAREIDGGVAPSVCDGGGDGGLAAFMTPVSSPVNTCPGPGNYSFSDFVASGAVQRFIVMAVCIAMIPMLFPF